jgi:hypothetical protein
MRVSFYKWLMVVLFERGLKFTNTRPELVVELTFFTKFNAFIIKCIAETL